MFVHGSSCRKGREVNKFFVTLNVRVGALNSKEFLVTGQIEFATVVDRAVYFGRICKDSWPFCYKNSTKRPTQKSFVNNWTD